MVLQNVGILPQCHNLKMEATWSSKMLISCLITTWHHNLNIGILPHKYMVSQPEDGSSKVLHIIGILPYQYTM